MKTKTILSDDRITTITNRIKKVYIVLFCIGILSILYDLANISENLPKDDIWQGVINSLLYFVLYIGLRLKTKWFTPLALISSAWFLLSAFLTTLQPAQDIHGLIAKAIGIIFVLFFAYQMNFFSKREVKIYFGLEGTMFF
jgi:hypothetical protein